MPRAKRVNLSKAEIENKIHADLALNNKKALARKIFPVVAGMPTVYDAQTVLNAFAGFVKFELQKKQAEIKVEDLPLDFSKEKESIIKDAVVALQGVVSFDNAEEVAEMLELMASKLPGYLAGIHMKDSMSTITVDEFIA